MNGKKEVAELLIAKGAKIDAQNQLGETPLQIAKKRNLNNSRDEIIVLLQSKGAK